MSSSDENKAKNTGSAEVLSPGVRLRRAREACDLSREEVASHLKLSLEKIKCLERGEVENIAAPVFVAGYLRSYARLVNLSGDSIVADFKALAEMELPSMDPASSPAANDYGQVGKASSLNMSLSGSSGLGVVLIWGIVVVLLVVGAYVFLTGNGESSARKNTRTNVIEETGSDIGFEAGSETGSEIDSLSVASSEKLAFIPERNVQEYSGSLNQKPINQKPVKQKPVKREPTKQGLVKPLPEKEKPSEKVAKAKIPAPFLAPSKNEPKKFVQSSDISNDGVLSKNLSELILYFTEESWVEVNDSRDQRLLYRLGKVGTSHTVAGLAPFNVRLGYVNGVSIMYNGEPYDLSHFTNRKSVRFQVGEVDDQMSGNQ